MKQERLELQEAKLRLKYKAGYRNRAVPVFKALLKAENKVRLEFEKLEKLLEE